MKIKFLFLPFLLLFSIVFVSCAEKRERPVSLSQEEKTGLAQATFAGGCFWCTEAIFEGVKGVKDVVSGYSGGDVENPTYREVVSGKTGHAEAIMIYFDPEIVSYDTLLTIFFAVHDPTTLNRQGPDVGTQYRSMILYHNKAQQKAAEEHVAKLEKSGKFANPIVTQIVHFEKFYEAEDYHQDYCSLNPSDPYVRKVSNPIFEKFKDEFKDKLKEEYQ